MLADDPPSAGADLIFKVCGFPVRLHCSSRGPQNRGSALPGCPAENGHLLILSDFLGSFLEFWYSPIGHHPLAEADLVFEVCRSSPGFGEPAADPKTGGPRYPNARPKMDICW